MEAGGALLLERYKTWVFDCDGVVLDSNRVKTDAFYLAALPYGEEAARALVDHHVSNGGVSRYRKFEFFLQSLVGNTPGPSLPELLQAYAGLVREGLLSCEVAQGLDSLRGRTPNATWMIVSGGDQDELRQVFRERKLDHLFDGGIFGSPNNKDEILSRETARGGVRGPAVFLGDSRYDYEAAVRAGLEFIFVSGWSEADYQFPNATYRINAISDLVAY